MTGDVREGEELKKWVEDWKKRKIPRHHNAYARHEKYMKEL